MTSNGKDSIDIVIRDKDSNQVKYYQSKYYKNAQKTQEATQNGDYRDQIKLVPADQVNQIENATDVIEIDGIKSKPLTKAEAKALQEKAQREAEIKQYDWNDASRIDIAKNISKQALIGAAFTAGMHGVRILGRRIWNNITGKQNSPTSEDLKEFFESSLKSTVSVGAQVAVSGAIAVAVKSGWLGTVMKNTPVGRIAGAAYVGMENAKILYKFAKGEISGTEAIDAMGCTTVSTVGSLIGTAEGAALGATWGLVGGPIGAVVGGLVGGIIGGMAGDYVGKTIYQDGKRIVKTAFNIVKNYVTTQSIRKPL